VSRIHKVKITWKKNIGAVPIAVYRIAVKTIIIKTIVFVQQSHIYSTQGILFSFLRSMECKLLKNDK